MLNSFDTSRILFEFSKTFPLKSSFSLTRISSLWRNSPISLSCKVFDFSSCCFNLSTWCWKLQLSSSKPFSNFEFFSRSAFKSFCKKKKQELISTRKLFLTFSEPSNRHFLLLNQKFLLLFYRALHLSFLIKVFKQKELYR